MSLFKKLMIFLCFSASMMSASELENKKRVGGYLENTPIEKRAKMEDVELVIDRAISEIEKLQSDKKLETSTFDAIVAKIEYIDEEVRDLVGLFALYSILSESSELYQRFYHELEEKDEYFVAFSPEHIFKVITYISQHQPGYTQAFVKMALAFWGQYGEDLVEQRCEEVFACAKDKETVLLLMRSGVRICDVTLSDILALFEDRVLLQHLILLFDSEPEKFLKTAIRVGNIPAIEIARPFCPNVKAHECYSWLSDGYAGDYLLNIPIDRHIACFAYLLQELEWGSLLIPNQDGIYPLACLEGDLAKACYFYLIEQYPDLFMNLFPHALPRIEAAFSSAQISFFEIDLFLDLFVKAKERLEGSSYKIDQKTIESLFKIDTDRLLAVCLRQGVAIKQASKVDLNKLKQVVDQALSDYLTKIPLKNVRRAASFFPGVKGKRVVFEKGSYRIHLASLNAATMSDFFAQIKENIKTIILQRQDEPKPTNWEQLYPIVVGLMSHCLTFEEIYQILTDKVKMCDLQDVMTILAEEKIFFGSERSQMQLLKRALTANDSLFAICILQSFPELFGKLQKEDWRLLCEHQNVFEKIAKIVFKKIAIQEDQ